MKLPAKITVTRDLAVKGQHLEAGTVLKVGADVNEKDAEALLENNGARETTDDDVAAAKTAAAAKKAS